MPLHEVRDLCREAVLLGASGRVQAGLLLAEQALKCCLGELGKEHYSYPLSLCTLGWLKREAALDGSAEFAMAVTLARRLAPSDFEHSQVVLRHCRDHALSLGHASEAEELGAELLQMHVEELGPDHPRTMLLRQQVRV